MAPKHHPTPLSGGDRKALNKELGKSRVNGGLPWLEIQCARCKTPSDVDLAAMKHPPTTFVHDLASRLRCRKCAKAGGVLRRHCCSLRGNRATPEPRSRKLAITAGIIDRHLLRP
jgi:hypothetical protein